MKEVKDMGLTIEVHDGLEYVIMRKEGMIVNVYVLEEDEIRLTKLELKDWPEEVRNPELFSEGE